ncbi:MULTISPECIES: periplasmic heavy metal sensor [Sulfitobacter]|jgi:uncharacterized membrane protein|uniref:Heavy-metal resistance n=1 Tax=Sulfitobacter dubius TaxID=218673 RepID=A0ABY3ZMR2_9RHOB|nr:periplasmic heavy metal sensor [Sulfitobacter dubius]UOA15390.1 hypothetical protein DSM109990_02222 [Sulfitobacter dubius]WOI29187.1 periplasmic heavy metal sensor [Sulfitobacter dubius]
MTQNPTPRRVRMMRWALGLSLALNVMIIGAVGGALWRHGGPDNKSLPGLRSYASPYVQALPPDARRDLHNEMRKGGKAHHLDRAARGALYEQMLAALRADPFEPEAAAAILTAQGDAAASVQGAAHSAWLAQVSAMAPETRQIYADKLQERLEAWSRGKQRSRSAKPER